MNAHICNRVYGVCAVHDDDDDDDDDGDGDGDNGDDDDDDDDDVEDAGNEVDDDDDDDDDECYRPAHMQSCWCAGLQACQPFRLSTPCHVRIQNIEGGAIVDRHSIQAQLWFVWK